MAAYLRSIDPYDHLITTSSDIESSLKDIWADPNIDTVQVHDYDSALTTRDTRFRGYVASLNAAYHKPVIIGEFGLPGNPRSGDQLRPGDRRAPRRQRGAPARGYPPPQRRVGGRDVGVRGDVVVVGRVHPLIARPPSSAAELPRQRTRQPAAPGLLRRRGPRRHEPPRLRRHGARESSSRSASTTARAASPGSATPRTSTGRASARAISPVAR